MKVLILYFSGTGNTRYVAERIREEMEQMGFQTEIHSIEEQPAIMPDSYNLLILGSPKYYEYPPFYFLNYLKKNLPAGKNNIPTMMFCTQVSPLETDFRGAAKILRRKNHRLIAGKSFPLANNMIIFTMFPPTDSEKVKANITNLRTQIKPFLTEFINGNTAVESPNRFLAVIEQLAARVCTALFPVFAMKYSASPQCTGCGLCAKKCPKSNITMRDGHPVFGRNCLFCMRCINQCPVNAILYDNKSCCQYKPLGKDQKN